MAMVEDFSNTTTCALRYFACALRSTDTHVLSGNYRTLTYIRSAVYRVESDEITGPFTDALGCSPGSLCGTLADVAGSAANVTAWAAGMGHALSLDRWWGMFGLVQAE